MRRQRDAERDPDSKVKRTEEGRAFQREDPMMAKDLVWAMVTLTRGTKKTCQSKERSKFIRHLSQNRLFRGALSASRSPMGTEMRENMQERESHHRLIP